MATMVVAVRVAVVAVVAAAEMAMAGVQHTVRTLCTDRSDSPHVRAFRRTSRDRSPPRAYRKPRRACSSQHHRRRAWVRVVRLAEVVVERALVAEAVETEAPQILRMPGTHGNHI